MLLRRPTFRLVKNLCIFLCMILLFYIFRACRGLWICFYISKDNSSLFGPRNEAEALNDQQCKEHHIVIVLGGYKTINLAMPLFKSLLYHHPVCCQHLLFFFVEKTFHLQGPLYFHFIADKRARRVIPTLFDTWQLPSGMLHCRCNRKDAIIQCATAFTNWKGTRSELIGFRTLIIHQFLD